MRPCCGAANLERFGEDVGSIQEGLGKGRPCEFDVLSGRLLRTTPPNPTAAAPEFLHLENSDSILNGLAASKQALNPSCHTCGAIWDERSWASIRTGHLCLLKDPQSRPRGLIWVILKLEQPD
jgi:hypothetical protein